MYLSRKASISASRLARSSLLCFWLFAFSFAFSRTLLALFCRSGGGGVMNLESWVDAVHVGIVVALVVAVTV